VILHGVNMVNKRAPYLPSAAGFDAPDAAFLAANGFNTVRLGLIYAGVEPTPGVYDEAYLDGIAATEATLAQHGIFSMLDFHQDLYNERFQGEGWPDWAVQDDGLPAIPQAGFPANYFLMPALNRAFDHFWANDPGPGGVGLQDRYAAAFRRVAERFVAADHTIGFDLMNEPWPGTLFATCANPLGCPLHDIGTLAPFHDRVIDRIREVETQKLVWYEPNVLFDFGADTSHPATGDPASGFSFHVYCLPAALSIPGLSGTGCQELGELSYDNADAQAQQNGDALLLTEFGATDDLAAIRRDVESAERHMIGWQYWHYCECDDPTTSGTGVQGVVFDADQPPSGSNVKEAKLAVLSRAYPQVVAGTPLGYDFDEQARTFDLALSTVAPNGASMAPAPGAVPAGQAEALAPQVIPASTPATEVFVPRRHYPNGYEVDVDGGGIASAPGATLLRVAACAGRERVTVTVRPPGQGGVDGPDCLVEGAQRPRLKLRLRPRRTQAGRRSCFKATVRTPTGGRVKGATVRIGRARAKTSRRGRAKLCRSFAKPGRYRATAKKLGFKPARRKIRVRP
jgi:endoglycosylceramidase